MRCVTAIFTTAEFCVSPSSLGKMPVPTFSSESKSFVYRNRLTFGTDEIDSQAWD